MNRRKFILGASAGAAGLLAGRAALELFSPSQRVLAATQFGSVVKSPFSTGEKETPFDDVTHYNNFYEFGTAKDDPAKNAHSLKTSLWTVSVGGEVENKGKY